jgi:AcrR family transcriptional regulator
LPGEDRPAVGLRERKKARTKAAIQQHAMRPFAERGYQATTVEQIAAAAEVSPSTFFRYFPTKEDIALYDALDPMVLEAFRAQPANLSPIQALRGAMWQVFAEIVAERVERRPDDPAVRTLAGAVIGVGIAPGTPLDTMPAPRTISRSWMPAWPSWRRASRCDVEPGGGVGRTSHCGGSRVPAPR